MPDGGDSDAGKLGSQFSGRRLLGPYRSTLPAQCNLNVSTEDVVGWME
jgi:hypothetical protein